MMNFNININPEVADDAASLATAESRTPTTLRSPISPPAAKTRPASIVKSTSPRRTVNFAAPSNAAAAAAGAAAAAAAAAAAGAVSPAPAAAPIFAAAVRHPSPPRYVDFTVTQPQPQPHGAHHAAAASTDSARLQELFAKFQKYQQKMARMEETLRAKDLRIAALEEEAAVRERTLAATTQALRLKEMDHQAVASERSRLAAQLQDTTDTLERERRVSAGLDQRLHCSLQNAAEIERLQQQLGAHASLLQDQTRRTQMADDGQVQLLSFVEELRSIVVAQELAKTGLQQPSAGAAAAAAAAPQPSTSHRPLSSHHPSSAPQYANTVVTAATAAAVPPSAQLPLPPSSIFANLPHPDTQGSPRHAAPAPEASLAAFTSLPPGDVTLPDELRDVLAFARPEF